MKLGTITVGNEVLTVLKVHYQSNNRIAIILETDSDEPYANLSINLDNVALMPDEFCVKTWTENEQIASIALKSGLFIDTGKRVPTGFCISPIWKLIIPCPFFGKHCSSESIGFLDQENAENGASTEECSLCPNEKECIKETAKGK